MTTTIIEVVNVNKFYGIGPARVQALKDVSLTIRSALVQCLPVRELCRHRDWWL